MNISGAQRRGTNRALTEEDIKQTEDTKIQEEVDTTEAHPTEVGSSLAKSEDPHHMTTINSELICVMSTTITVTPEGLTFVSQDANIIRPKFVTFTKNSVEMHDGPNVEAGADSTIHHHTM